MPYKLSTTLTAHSSDVKALSTPRNDLVLSASRDTTAISWQRSQGGQFAPETIFRPGTRYVNSIAYLSPTSDAPKGYVVTGSQDSIINVFALNTPKDDPTFSLLGHQENVCTLDVTAGGSIISGSWDRTAKVWVNFTLAYDLKGHTQAVWAVKAIDEDQYLTASADKTIKLWHKYKAIQTFTGHQDVVRGLALIPDIGFASCANDSEIRVWTLGGDLIYTLSGHTSFVYSLSVLPNGDLVSAGEDRTVRIWQDGDCSQVIVHPAISVWAVSAMPNGDIVSGCSNGVVRIFSSSEERWASAQDLKDYEARVASQALPSQQVGDVKKSDLSGPEALSAPGKKAGEVKMIKNGDVVEAHQWDVTSQQWQKIGDVVDAVGSGRKQLYQGKEYDYVFNVDIEDGKPPLKLPFNASENPYAAAQRFLQVHELPLTYLDEVVQFIDKNTSGVQLDSGGGEEYADPFTGASRYRSAGTGASTGGTEFADPFTGASRYRSPTSSSTPATAIPTTTASFSDPFTGGSRYTPQASSSVAQARTVPSPSSNIVPVAKAISFNQANITVMQGKIFQFNQDLQNSSGTAMQSEEVSLINEIFNSLLQVTANPPRSPTISISSNHVEAVLRVLDRWPSTKLFPVFDLCRLLVAFSPTAFNDVGLKTRFLETLFRASKWSGPWSSPQPKPRETNILLVLRTLANSVQATIQVEGSGLGQILEGLGQVPYNILAKTQRVAFATILFNISCTVLQQPLGMADQDQYIELLFGLLSSETVDSEAAFRAMTALGNVAYATTKNTMLLGASKIAEANQYIRALPRTFPEERMKNMSDAISALL